MDNGELVQLVSAHLYEAQIEQPDLELIRDYSGQLDVQGTIRFCMRHKDYTIKDAYEVKIRIPSNYPHEPPTAKETARAIPHDYRHIFLKSGNLCLGVPIEVRMLFSKQNTLLGFIKTLLIPSLFSYSYFRDHDGEFPFGEREHDIAVGLMDFYHEYFRTDTLATLRLLKYLADFEFPQRDQCPCGSQRELCFCHGRRVLELWGHQSPNKFAADLILIFCALQLKPLDPIWWTINKLMPKQWPNLIDMWDEFAKAD